MPTLPWRPVAEALPDETYVASATNLHVERWLRLPGFLWANLGIVRQARRSEGLVGYAMRAEMLDRSFWTVSVWEDADATDAFVDTDPHAEAADRIAPTLGRKRFARWRILGREVPPSWDEVEGRIDGESDG